MNDFVLEQLARVKLAKNADFLSAFACKVIDTPKKQFIYKSDEYASSVYRVKKGMVKDFRLTADGVEQITHFYLPGEIFGLESLIQPVYSSHTTSIFDCEVEQFPANLLKTSAHFTQQINTLLISEQIRAKSHIALLNKTCATTRLASFILNINSRLNSTTQANEFNFPRNEIANYLGLSVETVCRSINKLKKNQAINIEKTRIKIINIDKLSTTL